MSKRWSVVLAGALLSMSVAACGTPGEPGAPAEQGTPGAGGGTSAAPVKVGLVYSKSGPLATYGEQYRQGFEAGLGYATQGTGEVNGHKVEITEQDDAGDPAKAVAAATDLIGQGNQIIAGSTSSGVALQVAPIANDNKVLFISGPAAADAVTGANKYTFRSGRQTYQDVATAGSMLGDVSGKKVTVLAQDSAFGKANVAAVTAVLGGKGATVDSVEVPAAATDVTPFATKIKGASPDLLFVAWAGANAASMWSTLEQQGVFESTKVVTGLDIKPTHAIFGKASTQINFLSHFFDGAADNAAYQALEKGLSDQGATVDLFTNDGFVAAQMIVHAIEASDTDVDAMVAALEGWSFEGPKGQIQIRPEDHAVLQPMFTATLKQEGSTIVPVLGETLDAATVAPPVTPFK
ncbi:substrate-binding domain-containing protein [Intrasporangium calvum]|uniref:Amino acid/amide ABC transporter substrate-binding protein, HAAT family n=1 Tax=Intrasporangium calvum (strain ATCC 23552 / DSM 43043 / JCM 3097 / NBRC 12989 / NCIMB 10167 / NRRL B-3866 / 7 KIP) TaxID=710696 RepID=E6SBS6_INTC7|nr:substrate-binding domain-containing protein [Intrasporangium calvum]ADU48435.1 amino acid/amide ABC transporter substrate-binding protein, HAAT family [Intrasporangium calvum DSM 43043]